jgi:acetyltransferase-like isoleucine patch superfamily enzyme
MIDADVKLGKDVRIFNRDLVNIFGCEIGDGTFIGPFVEITRNVKVGRNCIIESHSFICDSVALEDDVFIGHGAMFVNDLYPFIGRQVAFKPTEVKKRASIGTNATIIGGVTIGEYAVVGGGAVVTKDVPAYSIVAGNPARILKKFGGSQELIEYMNSKQPLKKKNQK